jgi:hypothetical protein
LDGSVAQAKLERVRIGGYADGGNFQKFLFEELAVEA